MKNYPQIEANLQTIAQLAMEKATENEHFKAFLKQTNDPTVTKNVQELNEQIAAKVNCLACGNCCKSLLINVTEAEANQVAAHLQQTRLQFDAQHIEKGGNGMMLINTVPCNFLQQNNACSIYEQRFEGCREFPALHLSNFTKRLFTTFMHYHRCPIIYNVIEQLKTLMHFKM